MSASEFRRFVDTLDEAGELLTVTSEVDWDLEIGERTRREAAGRNRAVLFEGIRDCGDARILTNAVGSPSRIGMALGLPPGRSFRDLRRVVRTRLSDPLPAVTTPGGALDIEHHGEDVLDLTQLPSPRWSAEDVGRYLGTWHVNLTHDPMTGQRNVGSYRMQLIDRSTALISASAGSHLLAQVRRAESRGEPLEMAVAIGVPEPLILAAGAAVSSDLDELSLAGGLAGSPVGLRPCRLIHMDVPLDAEIVIEGRILPGERMAEGPFVDYAGVPSSNPRALVFRASVLSMRKNPIFRGAAIGDARAEDHLVYALLASAGCLDFHGSRARHHLQAVCLRAGWFRLFQLLGRVHPPTRPKRLARDSR